MRADWLNDPEYVKLVEFLVEKTKEVKQVLSPTELAREFKIKTSSPLKAHCLDSRIYRFRREISKMPHLDTETKVKLMFGLSGSVDQGFLRELRKEADVTVDDFNRIIHYKKNGGGFELQGIHRSMLKPDDWLNYPEYVKIAEFLVEKTKEVKIVLSVKELAREFKKQSNSELNISCLKCRIERFRRIIISLSHLDAETKVKLLFGLGAPVDYGFLKELRKEAVVTVDDFNRIIHYKKNEGGLELWGRHYGRKCEVSNDQIFEFLAKKVEETSGIIELSMLSKQLNAEIGTSQTDRHLQKRIRRATKQIYECESFDEEMKVRMMFATSTEVEEYALEELRKNATVVVDKKNKIKEYQRKDGSLYLNKKGSQVKRGNRNTTVDESDDAEDSEEDVEEEEELDDDSEEEEQDMKLTTRSGRLSKKRFSDASLFNNEDDMGHSSQRNERSKKSNTPTTSNKKRKISEYINGSVGKKKKGTREKAPEEQFDDDYSFDISYQSNEVKLEPFKGPLNDDTTRGNIINNGDDFVEEIPAPTENFVAPKYEETLMDVKMEEAEGITDQIDKAIKAEAAEDVMIVFDDYVAPGSPNKQYKNDPFQHNPTSSEDVKKDHTSLVAILEAFHDLIDTLNLSILTGLQKRIEAKLEECRGESCLKTVSNEEICLSLQLCLLKVNKNWEIEESLESFRLESFMISLRQAVIHMKCPSLIDFQEKLKKTIEELRFQNKFVPVTAIQSALEGVIYNIINS